MGQESIMRSRWVKRLSNDIPRWCNVRLGIEHEHKISGIMRVLMNYADLIYIDNNVVNIVEFKVRYQKKGVAQLLTYKQEFYKTIEFEPYWKYAVRMLLVVFSYDRVVAELCSANGIDYEVFSIERNVTDAV